MVAVCCVAAVLGAPNQASVDPELAARRALPALHHNEVRDGRGQYDLTYSTAEGIEVRETGRLVTTPDGKAQYLQIEGETRYIGTDGQLYVTKYTAGLDGTHVEGAHLPVSVVAEPAPVERVSS